MMTPPEVGGGRHGYGQSAGVSATAMVASMVITATKTVITKDLGMVAYVCVWTLESARERSREEERAH